jgi:hypothetical protein
MATFVVRSAGGKIESRHLRATCPKLVTAAEAAGISPLALRVRNTRRNGHGDESTRCELCFVDLGPLSASPRERPGWVTGADAYPPAPDVAYVYDIFWTEGRLSHVGSTADVPRRFGEYWRGVCKGGFGADNSIFWLNELLHREPDFEPEWEVERHPREDVVAAERRRRARRRSEGWEVATDV